MLGMLQYGSMGLEQCQHGQVALTDVSWGSGDTQRLAKRDDARAGATPSEESSREAWHLKPA